MSIQRKKVKVNFSRRIIKYRKPSASFKRNYEQAAQRILDYCDKLWRGDGSMLDTSVRDVLADGIARLLHVAFDCQSCALGLHNEAHYGFMGSSIAEWFRARGFAEWYCQGTATLFCTSRPQILSDQVIVAPKRRRRKG